MVAKSYILANLNTINAQYKKAARQKHALLWSKVAVIELCGWIEESMDDVLLRASSKMLKETTNRNIFQDIVKRNYGFHYHDHFRKMLVSLLGLACVEKVEKKLDPAKHARLKAALHALRESRNAAAHTHIKGVALSIDAPSVTISRFHDVYTGLGEIDTFLRQAKLVIK